MKTLAILLALGMGALSCGGTDTSGAVAQPATAGPEPQADVSLLLLTRSPIDPFTDAEGLEGVLRITEECVTLTTDAVTLLPVWPRDRATWDSQMEAVVVDGVAYSDGARLGLDVEADPPTATYDDSRCPFEVVVVVNAFPLG